MNQISERAKSENDFIHKYIIALSHAMLWVAALSFAAFAHLSKWFDHSEALLISTLVAYCAYICESGLGTWRVAASASDKFIDFKKGALWKWIWVNVIANVIFAALFLHNSIWLWVVCVIATAGWQKYMDGRIPPRLQSTMIPIENNKFKSKI